MKKKNFSERVNALWFGSGIQVNGQARSKTSFAMKAGQIVSDWLKRLTELQKKALVILLLLILASYFIFLLSKAFEEDSEVERAASPLPSLETVPMQGGHQALDIETAPLKSDTVSRLQTKP